MGYACPVCGVEQVDAIHLANHLAVTASLGREEHQAWLEEHAPDWTDRSPEALGAIVSEYAIEVETPSFEDDRGRSGPVETDVARGARLQGRGDLAVDEAAILQNARDLTRQMTGSDERTNRERTIEEPGDRSAENETE